MANSEQIRPGFIDGAPAGNFGGGLYEVLLPELGERKKGKVRDAYVVGGKRVMITTDRQSAFNAMIGTIPDKGKVLNLISAYWFGETSDIVPNHVIAVPHPNVLVARQVQRLGVEVVLRDYMAKSSSSTSVYRNYTEGGRRQIYGIRFPEGLKANERFPMGTIITPTTKSEDDEELTDQQARNIVDSASKNGTWEEVKRSAQAVFARGREQYGQKGLILADTKLEFGVDENGDLVLIDEILTPDSSRFWQASTYQALFEEGKDPETFDKELLRKWLADRGFKGRGEVPELDDAIRNQMKEVYISLYERATGALLPNTPSTVEAIRTSIAPYLQITNSTQERSLG